MTIRKTVGLEHLVQFGDSMSDMHPSGDRGGSALGLSVAGVPIASRQYSINHGNNCTVPNNLVGPSNGVLVVFELMQMDTVSVLYIPPSSATLQGADG
jgi:hypothetical protein